MFGAQQWQQRRWHLWSAVWALAASLTLLCFIIIIALPRTTDTTPTNIHQCLTSDALVVYVKIALSYVTLLAVTAYSTVKLALATHRKHTTMRFLRVAEINQHHVSDRDVDAAARNIADGTSTKKQVDTESEDGCAASCCEKPKGACDATLRRARDSLHGNKHRLQKRRAKRRSRNKHLLAIQEHDENDYDDTSAGDVIAASDVISTANDICVMNHAYVSEAHCSSTSVQSYVTAAIGQPGATEPVDCQTQRAHGTTTETADKHVISDHDQTSAELPTTGGEKAVDDADNHHKPEHNKNFNAALQERMIVIGRLEPHDNATCAPILTAHSCTTAALYQHSPKRVTFDSNTKHAADNDTTTKTDDVTLDDKCDSAAEIAKKRRFEAMHSPTTIVVAKMKQSIQVASAAVALCLCYIVLSLPYQVYYLLASVSRHRDASSAAGGGGGGSAPSNDALYALFWVSCLSVTIANPAMYLLWFKDTQTRRVT